MGPTKPPDRHGPARRDGPDAPLPAILEAALHQRPDAPLAVAFSGGPDSTALLHAFATLPGARARGLRALHVDHGLHQDSAAWARRCETFCEGLGVPVTVLAVTIGEGQGLGLEGAARDARYPALADALQPGELLACAHHRGDQAETVLLRLLRGSGVDGLAAMRPLRPLGRGWLWRPLLHTPRGRLLDYLGEHGLDAIDDPSNRDPRHDRAWLRHELLPRLQARWPAAEAALATSAHLAAEASELLTTEDRQLLASLSMPDAQVLDAHALQRLPPARQPRVLRLWIRDLGLPPIPAHCVHQTLRELLAAPADAEARVAWRDVRVLRWRDRLHAGHEPPALPSDLSLSWDGRTVLELPGGGRLGLDPPPADGFPWEVRVQSRRGGERLQLPDRGHRSTLKQLLQGNAVPPWERAQLPLLVDACGGEVLAAGDRFVSARLQSWLDRQACRLRWQPAP